MPQLILSVFTIIVVLVYCVVLLKRKQWCCSVFAQIGGLLACVVIEISDLGALYNPEDLMNWKLVALLAESFLPSCWLFFALTFARKCKLREQLLSSQLLLLGSIVFPFVALLSVSKVFYSPDFTVEKMLFLSSWGYSFYVALVVVLVLALFYLEQTLMSLSRSDRWRVKFEVVGAGVILTVLVFYYSQALFYRSINMNLMPVRSMSLALGVGLMLFSCLRRGEVMVRIRVSREIAYRSMVVLIMGVYLIGVGLFDTGMSYFNVTGNRVLVVSLAIALGLVLVIILLSEQMRRRLRVLLHKNFYQHKYDYRQEWMQFTVKLVGAKTDEELENNILEFYAETFFLQGAALFLRDPDAGRYYCSSCFEGNLISLSMPETQLSQTVMWKSDWVVDLEEDNMAMLKSDWSQIRHIGYTLLVPLRFEHRLEGFIALRRIYEDKEERLTYEDFDLMKILAHQSISVLIGRKLYADLVAANEMAAIGRVSTFVIHDLKNLVSGLGMMVENSREYIDDLEFREDMFETLENTVGNMKGLIERLQNVKQQPQLDLVGTDLLDIAKSAAAISGNESVEVAGRSVCVCGDKSELYKVLLNLLHNAREASSTSGEVWVEVGCTDMAFVQVSDCGRGMDAEFIRQRLFKPFETTKKKGVGIGLYQCQQVIRAHGGRIDVQSVPGKGSTFTVWLPLEQGSSGDAGGELGERGACEKTANC